MGLESAYDVFFVDQLSTCVPFFRTFAKKRVVFYCHFPDKLLANASFTEVLASKRGLSLIRRLYRLPMDWLEEATTSAYCLVSSQSIDNNMNARSSSWRDSRQLPVYCGSHEGKFLILARSTQSGLSWIERRGVWCVCELVRCWCYTSLFVGHSIFILDSYLTILISDRPTFLSLNRFEKKKNATLAVQSFALLRTKLPFAQDMRLVIAGKSSIKCDKHFLTPICRWLRSTTTG